MTQPVSDGVNENGRANVQSDDLILEDIEDADEPDIERESMVQNQTTTSSCTNNRLGERSVRESVQKTSPRQAKVAWQEAHGKQRKRWHILNLLRRRTKVVPVQYQDPNEDDLATQGCSRLVRDEEIDGPASRLSFCLPHCVETESYC